MDYRVDAIRGIGPEERERLLAARIETTQDLLERCSSFEERRALGEYLGIPPERLLTWANMADLMRISGVGPQYAELLVAATVDTILELRHRNPENLARRMHELNEETRLAKTAPSANHVQEWIDQAEALEPILCH